MDPTLATSRHGVSTFCLLLACLGGAVSCQRPAPIDSARQATAPSTGSNAVAVVGKAIITAEALRAQLQQRFPPPRTQPLSLEQKKSVLDSLIRSESIYAQAQATGFDQSAEVQAQIKSLIVSRFLERQLPAQPTEPTAAAVEAYYRANTGRFTQPLAARGAILFIAVPGQATDQKRSEARARAEALWQEARPASAAQFSKLVAQFSDDQASRYRGGDIGWQSPGSASLEPAVHDALLALEREPDLAPLVETERGFYIVKLLERRAAGLQPLAQVQKAIQYELARAAARQTERDFYDRMERGLNIQIDQHLLESIELPTDKLSPPRAPGMQTALSQ